MPDRRAAPSGWPVTSTLAMNLSPFMKRGKCFSFFAVVCLLFVADSRSEDSPAHSDTNTLWNVNRIISLLHLADKSYSHFQYDEAEDSCKKILQIDPINIAALKMLERIRAQRVNLMRSDLGDKFTEH